MMLYVQIGSDGMNSAVRKAGKFHTVFYSMMLYVQIG